MMKTKPTEALSKELPAQEGTSMPPHPAPGLPISSKLIPFLSILYIEILCKFKKNRLDKNYVWTPLPRRDGSLNYPAVRAGQRELLGNKTMLGF